MRSRNGAAGPLWVVDGDPAKGRRVCSSFNTRPLAEPPRGFVPEAEVSSVMPLPGTMHAT